VASSLAEVRLDRAKHKKTANLIFDLKDNLKIGHRLGGFQGCQMVCFQTTNPNLAKF
jgi:hypothetical protein